MIAACPGKVLCNGEEKSEPSRQFFDDNIVVYNIINDNIIGCYEDLTFKI